MPRVALLLTLFMLLLHSCARAPRTPDPDAPRPPTSNILRADYAGSAACVKCHGAIADRFARAPMRNMTRVAHGATIHAPFDGTIFHFKDDTATLLSRGDERFVAIASAQFGSKTYRVTRVIGGHHREDFAGVEVIAAEANAKGVGDGRDELILPVSYVIETKTLRYKGYSVMLKERPGLKAGGVWNQTCIFCHNTVPYFTTILGAFAPAEAPHYQGEIVDDLLPPSRRWSFSIEDDGALRGALKDEIVAIVGKKGLSGVDDDARALADRAVRVVKQDFDASHLIEVGIGCESCHGGSREHVESPRAVHPSLSPRAPFLSVKTKDASASSPERARAQTINRTCARCHQVLFSGYGYTWEGGTRDGALPGGSNINSGEARDFLMGGCASAMSCVDCHDPHAPDGRARMNALEGAEGDAVCQRCHQKFSGESAIAAHTHHRPNGEGARCVGCHLAKKNMSLDLGATRYHRIGAPNDPRRVERDRPLECALCHADKTVRSLVDTMESWWTRRFDRASLLALYGDLDANAMRATLEKGKPHEQAIAMFVLGRARDKNAVPLVARQVVHPIPILRYYAENALSEIFGEPCDVDLHRENGAIVKDLRAWLAARGASD